MHKSDCFQSNAKIQNHLLIYVKSRASSPLWGPTVVVQNPHSGQAAWSQGLSMVGVQIWASPSHVWEPLLGSSSPIPLPSLLPRSVRLSPPPPAPSSLSVSQTSQGLEFHPSICFLEDLNWHKLWNICKKYFLFFSMFKLSWTPLLPSSPFVREQTQGNLSTVLESLLQKGKMFWLFYLL